MKNLKNKPICILNTDGFFGGTIEQLRRAHEDGLLYYPIDAYFHVSSTPEDAVMYCQSCYNGMQQEVIDDIPVVSFNERMHVKSKPIVGNDVNQEI